MIVAIVLLWLAVSAIVVYLILDYRAGSMDGEDTIRRLAREGRRK